MRKRRVWLWLLIGVPLVLLLVAGAFVVLVLTTMPNAWPKQVPFEPLVWKAAKNWDSDNPRAGMVDSLLAGDRLKGMTKAQVADLLGPPDGVDHRFPDSMSVSSQESEVAVQFEYVLGMWSGYRMDYDWLTIHFDGRGRVVRWEVWQG